MFGEGSRRFFALGSSGFVPFGVESPLERESLTRAGNLGRRSQLVCGSSGCCVALDCSWAS